MYEKRKVTEGELEHGGRLVSLLDGQNLDGCFAHCLKNELTQLLSLSERMIQPNDARKRFQFICIS